jgi:hypothetical protein
MKLLVLAHYLIWILIKRCRVQAYRVTYTYLLACHLLHLRIAHVYSFIAHVLPKFPDVSTISEDRWTCYHKQVLHQMMTVTALRVRHRHSGFISFTVSDFAGYYLLLLGLCCQYLFYSPTRCLERVFKCARGGCLHEITITPWVER